MKGSVLDRSVGVPDWKRSRQIKHSPDLLLLLRRRWSLCLLSPEFEIGPLPISRSLLPSAAAFCAAFAASFDLAGDEAEEIDGGGGDDEA